VNVFFFGGDGGDDVVARLSTERLEDGSEVVSCACEGYMQCVKESCVRALDLNTKDNSILRFCG